MHDYTKWKRKDFGDSHGVPPVRPDAEKETNQDLQKPIQQIMCDVHEHAKMPGNSVDKMPWMIMRMVSMMGRVALEHERVGKRLIVLTWVLIALTVVLAALTAALIFIDIGHHHIAEAITTEHASHSSPKSGRFQMQAVGQAGIIIDTESGMAWYQTDDEFYRPKFPASQPAAPHP